MSIEKAVRLLIVNDDAWSTREKIDRLEHEIPALEIKLVRELGAAYDAVEDFKPDLIISDLLLGDAEGGGGNEAKHAAEFAKTQINNGTPTVVASNWDQGEYDGPRIKMRNEEVVQWVKLQMAKMQGDSIDEDELQDLEGRRQSDKLKARQKEKRIQDLGNLDRDDYWKR